LKLRSGVNSLAGTHKQPLDADDKRIGAKLVTSLIVLGILGALAVAWQWLPFRDLVDLEDLLARIKQFGHSPVAVAVVLATYLVGGLVLLPTTLLIFATVALFGPLMGVAYATLGCLLGAAISYALGRMLGRMGFDRLAGHRLDRVTAMLTGREILAVAAINWSQVVSLTLTGLAAGALRIRFGPYVLGTLIGVAPGIVIVAIFEDRLEATIRDPRVGNVVTLSAVALLGLFATLWYGQRFVKRWTSTRRRA
jgi:uncharacterized membrane protein YdjX (TVP38/TMEM64 family)